MSILTMPPRTYTAKSFEVQWENKQFTLSGTLDGCIDFALPGAGTYALSLGEAENLVLALTAAIADVRANCMYDRDALLLKEPPCQS